jgi:2-methylcitrate dehydratase PrpD
LGAFVAGARWDEVPAAVQHEAKRSILNGLGAALGAAIYPAVEDAVATVQPFAGPPQASVIGRPERFDILTASFVNAIGANAYDFDDTHLHTVIHPTAPVAPALLALAEHRGLAGADLLHAFVLGVEIECRLGNAVTPGHYARGWHITTTCGVFGAAAGSARLMGLDAGTTAHALGIAASQSGGIVENLAAGAKSIAMGNAARNGLLAALAAERGCTAAARAIEGPLGWARAAGDEVDVEELVGGLGARWELAKNTYKPYPCGIVLHPVIDACLALRQRHGIAAADVAGVIVNGHPLLLARADRPVANERDARISIHHSVAAVFLFAAAGLREYSDAAVRDAAAIALRGRVRAEADAAIPVGAARVSVRTVSGEIFSAEVAHARGSLELPMTDADIETKTRELAKVGCPSCDVARVIDAVWTLDRMTDVGELMALLRSARARRSD